MNIRRVEFTTERNLSCRVEWPSPDCQEEKWAGGRRQEAGDRRQEAGGRRQEVGDKIQEAGAGSWEQEAGGR